MQVVAGFFMGVGFACLIASAYCFGKADQRNLYRVIQQNGVTMMSMNEEFRHLYFRGKTLVNAVETHFHADPGNPVWLALSAFKYILKRAEKLMQAPLKLDEAMGAGHFSTESESEGAQENTEGLEEGLNPLTQQALDLIKEQRRANTSMLQRHLRIGYASAARILDDLEGKGFIGPPRGTDPREIFV